MKTQASIVLIGAGNVATQLGKNLFKAGYHISQVYSQHKTSSSALAKTLKAEPITDLTKLDPDAAIYIIAVKDDALAGIAKKIKLEKQLIVHTSGSVPMDVLKNVSENYGVFYPLQTFSKNKDVSFKTVPLCIEGNNKNASTTLQYFAKSISRNVQMINSGQRRVIHLAAVFACNFSNHMYAVAEGILQKEKLSLDLLKPLIEETAEKIKKGSPAKMQTGPAIRKDKKTMDAQLKMLKEKKLKAIYKLVSEHIINSGNK